MTDGAADPALVLECLGWKCPRPIIELARRIREVQVGEVIKVIADDPAAGPDVAAWCRMQRHERIASAPPEFWVRRLH
jgi:tRNA 2-thiouridine synthesizing protein A